MDILVAGGAGYIGSIAAAELIKRGHRVSVLDSLAKGHRRAVPKEAVLIEGDLGNRGMVDAAFQKYPVEAVLHFASLIEAGESMQKPGLYFQNNLLSSLNLIDAAAAHGVRKFVLSSTAMVYRPKNDGALSEKDPLDPPNVYGESKLMIERILTWYERVYGLRYASLRYFNAAGATEERGEDHRPESHLIPRVLQVALGQQEAIEIYGTDYPTPDGTGIRDYIHVWDLAQAHILALEALEGRSLIYNVGTGQGYSVHQVIEAARKITSHPIPAVERPRRPGDAVRVVAAADKIRRELGWQPRFGDLESIVESAWRWRRAHPQGYPD